MTVRTHVAEAVGLVALAVSAVAVVLASGGCPLRLTNQRQLLVTAAKAQIKSFSDAIELYKLRMGNYPTTEEGMKALVEMPANPALATKWKAPMLDAVPRDPWGKDYIYKCPGKHSTESFDIISAGPDGQEDTADDVKNWSDEGA